MNSIIRWSLRRRFAVLLAAIAVIAGGAYTARRMPVDVFPDLTAPAVTVITEVPGMAPEEIEALVTLPIESAINGASGVRRVRSTTMPGVSLVWAEFDWSEDVKAARVVVGERLAAVRGELPPQATTPLLAPVTSILGEIYFLGVLGGDEKLVHARGFADTVLRRRLLSVPGVAQVIVLGGSEKQLQVLLEPARLLAAGVRLGDVVDSVRGASAGVSAGYTTSRGTRYVVSGSGRARTAQDVASLAVRSGEGTATGVGDLGTVVEGTGPVLGLGSVRGHNAVIVGIGRQPDANTVALTAAIERELDKVERLLPAGVRVVRDIFRQSDFIDIAVRNVVASVRDGGILVVLVVALFLASLRATLVTLTALPLSLCAAVMALQWLGASFNTMTLGGLAIAVGALVDDAVIDVENVVRRLRQNATLPPDARLPPLRVVYAASCEIRGSIVFATLIVMLVFAPVFFLPGVEGRLLQPLGVSYIVALFASLVVAMTLTPVLCYFLLSSSRELRRTEPRLIRGLKTGYGWILDGCLRSPRGLVLATVALLFLSVWGALTWGRSFLPEFNEGTLTINVTTLPGTSLERSDELGRRVEEVLLGHAEVVSTARRTGRAAGDEHAQGAEASELDVKLEMRGRSKESLLAALREDLARVPGVAVSIGQPISHRIDHMLSGTRASLAVKVFGADLHAIQRLGARVEAAMAEVPGITDLSLDRQGSAPFLEIAFERQAMRTYGVAPAEAAAALAAAFRGIDAGRITDAGVTYPLVVRLDEGRPLEPEDAAGIPVDASGGAVVRLGDVARIQKAFGPASIERESLERKVVVQANVAGRDIASVVDEVREHVDPLVRAAPGCRVEYGGQFESAQRAARVILLVSLLVIAASGMLLYMAFGCARDALIVLINLPLSLFGGVAGVHLGGGVLSVASLVGFITLFGIATRNGILLVSHYRHLQLDEGVTDLRDAVRRGSIERLAPVLMTALATALALVPLVVAGEEPGNEIQSPMAVVVLCGLLTSTFLNLILVPAVYVWLGRPAERQEERSLE